MTNAPQSKSYDAAVVGAGVIGLACAWRLAQSGRSVVVLERDRPGAGASGVAAGMLAPVTEVSWGQRELLRLNLESASRWPAFDAELREQGGRATGYESDGTLMVAVDRDDAAELRRMHEFQRSLGLDVDWLTPSACRELEPGLSPGIAGGVSASQDHQVDPRLLVEALAAAVERAGGELVAGAGVERIKTAGGRVSGAVTAHGCVALEQVVIAAGCWAIDIGGLGAGTPPVRPVKGQILRLRGGGPPLASRTVHTPRCYVVPRSSGEVVVGATVEERGFDTKVTAGGVLRLLEAAKEALPDVEELELVEFAARLRPGTPDNLPVVGAGAFEGLVWATGHYRNGILLAPLTADAALAALEGDPAPLGDAAAPARFAASVGRPPSELAAGAA